MPQIPPVGQPNAQAAVQPPLQHQALPRAAGYPIGAVPTDSISRLVITALNAGVNAPPNQQGLGKLGVKIDAPGTYNGSSKLKDFEQWVSGMIRWFRLQSQLGPDKDHIRVYLLGHHCEGPAKDWYYHTVENCDQGPESWTTLGVIQGLQARFITQRSAAEAAQGFRTIVQGTMDAQELYQELRLLSMQLPVQADEYSFAYRFMEALNPSISKRVMMNGYSAESTEIELLVQAATDAEMTIRATRQFEETRASSSSTTTVRKERDRKGKSRMSGERMSPRPTTSSPAAARPAPIAQPAREQRPATKGDRGSGPVCYRCRKPGHIAPNCPNTIAAKAAEVIEGEPLTSGDTEHGELHVAVAGLHMESDGEESDLDSHRSEDAGSDYSDDSVWGRFNEAHVIGANACTLVPLEPEVDANAATPKNKGSSEPEPVLTPAARKRTAPLKEGQPVRTERLQRPITGYFQVGPTVAHILFDSGLGADMISPEFIRATRIRPIELETSIGLQLATIGSRSKINFGVNTPVEVGPVRQTHYFDVVNIEKYDVIIGSPFMRKYGVVLDFSTDELVIGNTRIADGYRAKLASRPKGNGMPHPGHRAKSTNVEPLASDRDAMAIAPE